MPSFNKVVKVTPNYKNCQQIAHVELATLDPQSHLNIYVSDSTAKGAGISRLCMMPQDAIALRDALMEAYPVRTYPVGPRFVVDPVKPNPFVVGDRVRYQRIAGYGNSSLNEGAEGDVVSVDSATAVTVRFGSGLYVRTIKVGIQYLTKVEKVVDTGTYIVALNENGGPKPSANPHVHTSRTAAETEAERLASKHGGDFVVYRAVTMKRRPKVVVPPVSSIKLD